MAQYPHPQPCPGLAPQLGLGGQSQIPATQGDPIRAPKQREIHPKQQSISLPDFWRTMDLAAIPSTSSTIFRCILASLYEGLSVRWLVHQSVSLLIHPSV